MNIYHISFDIESDRNPNWLLETILNYIDEWQCYEYEKILNFKCQQRFTQLEFDFT